MFKTSFFYREADKTGHLSVYKKTERPIDELNLKWPFLESWLVLNLAAPHKKKLCIMNEVLKFYSNHVENLNEIAKVGVKSI